MPRASLWQFLNMMAFIGLHVGFTIGACALLHRRFPRTFPSIWERG